MIDYNYLLELAIEISSQYHFQQVDKSGEPYILHPLAVMNNPILKTHEEKIVAICHDLFEDTEMTPQKMLKIGFPERIVNCISALSKPDNMEYADYIQFIKNYPDPIVRKVKIADLIHNSDMSRLKNITEKDIKRTEKYKNAIKELDQDSLITKVLNIKQFIDNNKKFDDIIYQITVVENQIDNETYIKVDYNYDENIEDQYRDENYDIPNRYNRIYRMVVMQEYFFKFSDIKVYIDWKSISHQQNEIIYKIIKKFE